MEDCSDASDEQSCENIVLPDFYPKEEAPPPMGNGTLADILFSIEVIEVLGLDEVQSTMELRYTMTFKWRDSREYRRSCLTFARFADFRPHCASSATCQCSSRFLDTPTALCELHKSKDPQNKVQEPEGPAIPQHSANSRGNGDMVPKSCLL